MKSSETAKLMVRIDYLQADVARRQPTVSGSLSVSPRFTASVNLQDSEDLGLYKGRRKREKRFSRWISAVDERGIITVRVKGSIHDVRARFLGDRIVLVIATSGKTNTLETEKHLSKTLISL